MRPVTPPIGLQLARTARAVSRSFDVALESAGGSLPEWLVLLNLKTRTIANQRELADAAGVHEATLTHHLNAMEIGGLIARTRDPADRRVHVVTLTPAGEAVFERLRDTAVAFDQRLRRGMGESELATLRSLLERLAGNAAAPGGSGQQRPGEDVAQGHSPAA